jgi:hypothetical protein
MVTKAAAAVELETKAKVAYMELQQAMDKFKDLNSHLGDVVEAHQKLREKDVQIQGLLDLLNDSNQSPSGSILNRSR